MHNDRVCPKYTEPVLPDENGNCSLCGEEIFPVISVYSLEQAIADGVLVELFKDDWQKLSGGKPIVATAHLYNYVCAAEVVTGLIILLVIWQEYAEWRKTTMPTLPEAEQMFVTTLNGNKIWLIEDEAAYTMMYPD